MDYKYHINTRFSSCQLIARARDEHRGRDVKLYHLPGNFEYVGVNDGTDSWICPVISDPFSAAVGRQLQRIREGKEIVAVSETGSARRRAVVRPQMELPLPVPAPPARERRKAVLVSPEPQVRSRHVVRR